MEDKMTTQLPDMQTSPLSDRVNTSAPHAYGDKAQVKTAQQSVRRETITAAEILKAMGYFNDLTPLAPESATMTTATGTKRIYEASTAPEHLNNSLGSLSFENSIPSPKLPKQGTFKVPGTPRNDRPTRRATRSGAANIGNDKSTKTLVNKQMSSFDEDAVDDELPPPSKRTVATTVIQLNPVPAILNKSPFCCDGLERRGINTLYNCDNATCIKRKALILLTDELKNFHHGIPYAPAEALKSNDYIISVAKYIPEQTVAVITSSRVKTIAEKTGQDNQTNYIFDKDFGGPEDRFYVAAATGTCDKDGYVYRADDESIWWQVKGLGFGIAGHNRLLAEYNRVDASKMDFECETHVDEKWICHMWVKKVSNID